MSPERIEGNIWQLFEGEYIMGLGGTIKGPALVRVHEFPKEKKLLIQAGEKKVEVEGGDFESAVQKD